MTAQRFAEMPIGLPGCGALFGAYGLEADLASHHKTNAAVRPPGGGTAG